MTKLFPKGSEWRRWDLQVQTILDDGYVELKSYSTELKAAQPEEWDKFILEVGSEEDALKFDSKEYFFTSDSDDEKTRAKNYANTFISFLRCFHKDEICLAITDHNYNHPYLLDELIKNSKCGSVNIIGGVEVNVQGVHMLALFEHTIYKKLSFSEGIATFLSKIEVDNKATNGVLTVSNKSYTDVIRLINENNGIAIYPHCNSNNGLFQERGKTDRTHLGDQFNFQDFNILQGKNKSSGLRLLDYIANKSSDLTSGYCYTTATDARCLRDILCPDEEGNYTWIKADPTFEGLRQIMFEPSRIAVQANLPEDKVGYQVIDRIEISNPLILNSEITFNANMNSIVGGRSTGKSVLLTAIAQKLKTEEPVTFAHKPDYGRFVQEVSNSMTVIWKDSEENDAREIEFFQQGYMFELATNEKKLSELVQNILRIKGRSTYLETYFTKKVEIKKAVSSLVNDLFQVMSEIKRRSVILSEKGDKKGVEDEITRLEEKLTELDSLSLTEAERQNYDQDKQIIEEATQALEQLSKDLVQIERLRGISLARQDIEYEFSTISEVSRNKVDQIYKGLTSELNQKWKDELNSTIVELDLAVLEKQGQVDKSKANADYIKASNAYSNSSQLNELQDRIKGQREKLHEIIAISVEMNEFKKQWSELRQKLILNHNEYFLRTEELLPNLSDRQDGLDINAHAQFDVLKYRSILESALNLQSLSSRSMVEFEYRDNIQYIDTLDRLLTELLNKNITLKAGYNEASLTTTLLTECFYNISYDLVYENDNFSQMSDGKKAFVVLKLLLDFSEKRCPILIDQPEDDLDNRAIYLDLVQYLKKKKIDRQIIVATHNPNIVVASDSELVIVANQHGIKNENADSKKFAYISGSLESSEKFDPSNVIVLEAQGIREHVCVILEGGGAAFRLREKKYALTTLA